MKRLTFFTLLITLLLPLAAMADDNVRAKQILHRIDDLWRGTSSHAVLSMQVKTAHYTRNMRMEAWSKGKEQSLVRILSPLKEKGTATLKSGNTIYTYLPRTDRTILLTSGMMLGSWMGSHFTNDDLVKESRMEDDYNPVISFDGMREGQHVLEFTLMPKPEATVVWGRIVLIVTADTLLPLSEKFFDEDMQVTRSMYFSDVKKLGGREVPSRMRMVPSDKPDEFTELVYEQLELDIPLREDFFSLAHLKRF